jgi:hypothetical protein
MNKHHNSFAKSFRLLAVLLLCCSAATTFAQNNKPTPAATPSAAEKCEAIIKRAIELYGGANYLNVRTLTGKGNFTSFHDGVSQLPAKFIDYTVLPDKERVEFTGGGSHVIQVNNGDTGWIFDGASKNLSDQKPDQVEDFKFGVKTSIEYLLRGHWRKDGGKLSYLGRREAGLGIRNEAMRMTLPDGSWIEYEFGARDGFPAKIIYVRSHKNMDSGQMEEMTEEDRLLKPISIEGITAPWVIDHYIGGKQTSRINYESIEYNRPIAESLFTKPASIKGLK